MGCCTREGGEWDPSSLVIIVNCDVATVFNYSAETHHDVHSALQREGPTPCQKLSTAGTFRSSFFRSPEMAMPGICFSVPWANLPPHLG